MHGLINRSFENFLRNTYQDEVWAGLMDALDAGFDSFEPMFHYDDAVLFRLVDLAAERLEKPRETLLEDWGIYLVAHPASERVRRLLRFGGVDFVDFLFSLEDLPGRARLTVPDLELPTLEVFDLGEGKFRIECAEGPPGFAEVLLGLLRALADDYGALVLIDTPQHAPDDATGETAAAVGAARARAAGMREQLVVHLLEAAFSTGRNFNLAPMAARS